MSRKKENSQFYRLTKELESGGAFQGTVFADSTGFLFKLGEYRIFLPLNKIEWRVS